MEYRQLKEYILSGNLNQILKRITCSDDISKEIDRYINLLDKAYKLFGDGDYHFISSPGRSEIGGNHTDHQHGHILAASLNIDNLVVVKANNSNIVNYYYDDKKIVVDLSNLEKDDKEVNTSESLIRGIASRIKQLGYNISGFDGLCDTRVLVGSGISSSACFEVMIAEVFNSLFNDGTINPVDRALISQYAENVYFGKPSGLMDQMSISVGEFVAIDFKDPNNPIIENHDFSFSDYGYQLVLVDTKGSHQNLSHEYSAITSEIKMVSNQLNVEYLADSSLDELMANIDRIRDSIKNDRAILRAIHFYLEDERAIKQKQAIINKDIDTLLYLMRQSGSSSYEYLQNANISGMYKSQSICVGLAISDAILKNEGVSRVHGGGFEGTIQAIVPNNKLDEYSRMMNKVFGDDCLLVCSIRPVGTLTII